MAKVYLETSFFSAAVSTRTSDKIAGWRASSLEFWDARAREHELFVSDEVIAELSDAKFQNAEAALRMVRNLAVLALNEEVLSFAELLVAKRAMPGPALSGDAVHVATAAWYRMDYLCLLYTSPSPRDS